MAAARAAAAQERSDSIEREWEIKLAAVSDRIPEEKHRIFNYIRDRIASGTREAADVAILREARDAHFRQLRLTTKEVTSHE